MSTTTRPAHPETAATGVPAVPLTVEGYSVLHQMMRIRWSAWRQLRASQKADIVHEAASVFGKMEQNSGGHSETNLRRLGPPECATLRTLSRHGT